jgi:prevent-host-death family protein
VVERAGNSHGFNRRYGSNRDQRWRFSDRVVVNIQGSHEQTRESAIYRRRRSQHRNSHLSALFNFGRLGDMNKTIGIAVAKARLFEIIDRVESGETIIIARNGAPVAQLRPLEQESLEDAKCIRAIGQRVTKRNKAKQFRPLNGTSFPDIPQ